MNIYQQATLSQMTGPKWRGYSRAHKRKIALELVRTRPARAVAAITREAKAGRMDDYAALEVEAYWNARLRECPAGTYGPSQISLADWDPEPVCLLMAEAIKQLENP